MSGEATGRNQIELLQQLSLDVRLGGHRCRRFTHPGGVPGLRGQLRYRRSYCGRLREFGSQMEMEEEIGEGKAGWRERE